MPDTEDARRGATIYSVADDAGVSIATVSRVLQGSPLVSDRTRQKVVEAMDRLDYLPSGAARSLAVRQHDTQGLVLPELNGPTSPSCSSGSRPGRPSSSRASWSCSPAAGRTARRRCAGSRPASTASRCTEPARATSAAAPSRSSSSRVTCSPEWRPSRPRTPRALVASPSTCSTTGAAGCSSSAPSTWRPTSGSATRASSPPTTIGDWRRGARSGRVPRARGCRASPTCCSPAS